MNKAINKGAHKWPIRKMSNTKNKNGYTSKLEQGH